MKKKKQTKLGGLSKEGRQIARELLSNEEVTREQLEVYGDEAVCEHNEPMDAVNSIAERAGLTSDLKLELRRVVIAKIRQRKFSVGQQVFCHKTGGNVMIVSMKNVPVTQKAVVHPEKGEEVEVYLTDLEEAQ